MPSLFPCHNIRGPDRYPLWEEPTVEPAAPTRLAEPSRPAEPTGPAPERPVAAARGRDWDREIGWEREPEPVRPPERRFEREPRPIEPEEPSGRRPEREEIFDPDLPPSRTDRTRGRQRRSSRRSRTSARYRDVPVFPEREAAERDEPPAAEPEIESFGTREPRRGRGRGRSGGGGPVAAGAGRPRGDPGAVRSSRSRRPTCAGGARVRRAPALRGAAPAARRPRRDPVSRRRRVGAAPRARGPCSRRARGQAPPEVQWRRAPETPELPRERETERERPRERDRNASGRASPSASGATERPGPRPRGEPGYVPRRERMKSGDSRSATTSSPPSRNGRCARPNRRSRRRPSRRAAEFVEEDELIRPEDEGPGGPRGEGRRQRQRRGRRRDRESRRDLEAREPSAAEPDELEADFEDLGERSARSRGRSRRRPRGSRARGRVRRARPGGVPGRRARGFRRGRVPPRRAPRGRRGGDRPRARAGDPQGDRGDRGTRARDGPARAGDGPRPRRGDEPAAAGGAGRGRGLVKPPIQEIFRRGDEVLVQVIKESIGTKGPTLSTYISIPGRYLVLMPGLNRVGVSRKIVDEGQRRKLREIMNELNPPKGLGFIVRTAGLERTKRELARDLAYLLRLWKVILRRIKKSRAPTPIYQESDMIIRTIRDIFTSEIDTIWIDEPAAFERAQDFLKVVMPRFVNRLKLYDEKVPLFHKYGIEDEIAKIQRRHVPLPEGGSIVIDPTEALVAIDVNSGNFRVEDDAETHRLRDEPAGRQGDRAAAPAPRPGRRDRQRLHRHARGAASPRGRACPARRHQARPRPDQGPAHERLRPDRDDPPAHPAQPQAVDLPGLPGLQRRRRRQDGREHGHRRHAAAGPGHASRRDPPDRGRRQSERRHLSEQPQAQGDSPGWSRSATWRSRSAWPKTARPSISSSSASTPTATRSGCNRSRRRPTTMATGMVTATATGMGLGRAGPLRVR